MAYKRLYSSESPTTTRSGYQPLFAGASDIQKNTQLTNQEILKLGRGPVKQEVAQNIIRETPKKLETISSVNIPEKKWPLGFVGEMAQAAYETAKATIDNAANKLSKLVDSLGEYNLKDYQKLALERQPGETNEDVAARMGIKKNTPLNRGVAMAESGLATAGVGFLPVTAQIEAATKLPGPLAIPAKIASGIFEDLGRLGSFTLGKGVDALPLSEEVKTEIKPVAEELGAFVAQLVGIKAAHKVSSKGVNLEKLNLKETTKTKISNTAQLATGLSVTPFSTIYGMVSSRIAYKVAQKQEQGIEITPEIGKSIIAEVKKEVIEQPLPDIKTKTPEFVFEKPVEIPKAPGVLDSAVTVGSKIASTGEISGGMGKPIPMDVKPSGTGKVTKPASEINTKLTEQGFKALPEEKLAKYTPTTKKETIETVSQLIENNVEFAKRIAIGKEESRLTDVEKQVLFNTLEKKAIKDNDTQLLIELAKSPIATERSVAAQTLGSSAWEKDSVIKNLQEAIKIKEANFERKTGKKVDKAKKEMVEEIKKEIKKSEPKVKDWDSFIESIKCK